MTRRRLLIAFVSAAAVGLAVFGIFTYRSVTIERAPVSEALRRFTDVRNALGGRSPLLTLDDAGNVVRRQDPPTAVRRTIRRFRALAYRAAEETLVTVDVPFWFFKIKGTAAQYAVRGTGLDLERLRITGADLERYEPAVVIDHLRPNGDRLLVWTE
jgi:hypothetical protein